MVYKVKMTQESGEDLSEIVSYISETLQNKPAAASLVDEFYDNVNTLKSSPYSFPLSCDLKLSEEGYRKFIFKKNYIALFLIDEINAEVNIMRVFYAKRNYVDLI